MQSLAPDPKANYQNISDALVRIRGQEGLWTTCRGITAVVYGAGPAHAMYFACYEHMKKHLSVDGRSNHAVHGRLLHKSHWSVYKVWQLFFYPGTVKSYCFSGTLLSMNCFAGFSICTVARDNHHMIWLNPLITFRESKFWYVQCLFRQYIRLYTMIEFPITDKPWTLF